MLKITGFPRVMEILEYHGILKGLFQTLKVREFYIFFCPSHGISGIFVCQLHSVLACCVLCKLSPELSFSLCLSCAWMGKYIQKYKKPVLASNFVALTMINLYFIFTCTRSTGHFLFYFRASSVPCKQTSLQSFSQMPFVWKYYVIIIISL